MSDPRTSASRGSKTAAVVMLVVFIQVLVVAVLGLGAIARDKQEAQRQSREQAEQATREQLETILREAAEEVEAALNDVRTMQSFRELELLRSGGSHAGHSDLVNTVYQVDPDTREVFWMDGEHRLFVPAARRVVLVEAELAAVATADNLLRVVDERGRREIQVRNLLAYVQRYPYLQHEDSGFVWSLGHARGLVDVAAEEAEIRETAQAEADLEQALLAALEVVALNRDREGEIPVGDRPTLDDVPRAVEAALAYLPPQARRHVEAYDDARHHLVGGFLTPLNTAMDAIHDVAGAQSEVAWISDRLLGLIPGVLVPSAQGSRHVVVLLNREAALHLIRKHASSSVLQGLGVELRVVDVDDPARGDPVASEDLRQWDGLKMPYRAELRRVRPLDPPATGPGAFFYWGIILLSAAGLGMGGYVLMRLYTREVRLARLKADFVSNLSHELKTPLTSIAMFTEMLQDGQLESEEDRQEGLGVLAQESDRLQRIVGRMLDTAKREARGVPYELAPGDLNEVVARVAARFRRIVTEPGLELEVDLAPGALGIQMDPAAIDDVVSNLVSNAWKYRRGDEAHIAVRTARRGRRAEVTVSDDGVGIPRRERRKVFEMFYRADAYLTRVAGTGLGLSLVRTIVRAHRGTARIETGETGQGALFRIRFPLDKDATRVETSPDSASTPTPKPDPDSNQNPSPPAKATP